MKQRSNDPDGSNLSNHPEGVKLFLCFFYDFLTKLAKRRNRAPEDLFGGRWEKTDLFEQFDRGFCGG